MNAICRFKVLAYAGHMAVGSMLLCSMHVTLAAGWLQVSARLQQGMVCCAGFSGNSCRSAGSWVVHAAGVSEQLAEACTPHLAGHAAHGRAAACWVVA